MKRKDYEKPATQVVELRQRTVLLAGSNGTGSLTPMDDPENLAPEFLSEVEDLFPENL